MTRDMPNYEIKAVYHLHGQLSHHEVLVCKDCGLVVGDKAIHEEWHQDQKHPERGW